MLRQEVHAEPEVSATNHIHVNDILEITNARQDEIFLYTPESATRHLQWLAFPKTD